MTKDKKITLKISDAFYCIGDKKYYFDIDRLKELCLMSSSENTRENEITESYTLNEDNEMELNQRVNREIKSTGNSQDDMIVYDAVKMFLDVVLGNEQNVSSSVNEMDTAYAIALNTLIVYGLLVEIK